MNPLKSFPMTALALFIFLGAAFFLSYYHETSHKVINSYYGVSSHLEWFSQWPDVVTVQDSGSCKGDCILAHSNAESFFYPFQIFAIACLFFLLILIVLFEAYIGMFFRLNYMDAPDKLPDIQSSPSVELYQPVDIGVEKDLNSRSI